MISDTLSEAHHAIRRYLNSSWGRKAYEPLRELLLVEMNEIRKILDTPMPQALIGHADQSGLEDKPPSRWTHPALGRRGRSPSNEPPGTTPIRRLRPSQTVDVIARIEKGEVVDPTS